MSHAKKMFHEFRVKIELRPNELRHLLDILRQTLSPNLQMEKIAKNHQIERLAIYNLRLLTGVMFAVEVVHHANAPKGFLLFVVRRSRRGGTHRFIVQVAFLQTGLNRWRSECAQCKTADHENCRENDSKEANTRI